MLVANSITKEYSQKKRSGHMFAVHELSITLEPGSVLGVTGRSGSGKTTLLNMLAGLLIPTSGKVEFEGQDIYSLADKDLSLLRNKNFGIIPQTQTGIDSLTVLENILLPDSMYTKSSNAESDAKELMSRLNIDHLANAYPKELSGGELRRLAIARALITNPKIIFADEPTGDLDDENTHIILHILREYADNGRAIMLVTHEQDALSYADHIIRMDAGKIM